MIRAGTPADLPAIAHVRTSVIENHLSMEGMAARGITMAGIAADMKAGHLGTWVAEAEGQIVAFSMADRRDGSVFALFTLPGHERKGYGDALLAECERWLKLRGFTDARLDTGRGTTAEQFYLKRGWQVTDGKAVDPDDVSMSKRL